MTENTAYRTLRDEVIVPGLCTHCGTCVGLSRGSLRFAATGQGALPEAVPGRTVALPPEAVAACPGRGIDYPFLWEAVSGRRPGNWLIGCHESLHVGHAADETLRAACASGGVITRTLLYLLEENLVDGVVEVRPGRPGPRDATPVIATTADEVRACAQSVYVPVPVNAILGEMEAFDGRLAYVGLPDQVASLRQLQREGHAGALKVQVVLGPYVGTAMYPAAIDSFLRSSGVGADDAVTDLRYREGEWPGYLQITLASGRVLRAEKFYYNYLIPFYITSACLRAVDFTNELTDISVGDAWHPRYESRGKGFAVVIARTERGAAVLSEMQDRKLLHLEPVSTEDVLGMHGHMLDFKKRGAFIRLRWRRFLGRRVPEYGYRPVRLPFSRYAVEAVISLLFLVCGTRLARWLVERIPLRLVGPVFNSLRKTWKRLSRPTKRKGLGATQYVAAPAGGKQ